MQEMLEGIILGAFTRLDAMSQLGICFMRSKDHAAWRLREPKSQQPVNRSLLPSNPPCSRLHRLTMWPLEQHPALSIRVRRCAAHDRNQVLLLRGPVSVTPRASTSKIDHTCIQQVHGLVLSLFRRVVAAQLLLRPLQPSQRRVQPMRHIFVLFSIR